MKIPVRMIGLPWQPICAFLLSLLLPISLVTAVPVILVRYLVLQLAKLIYWRKVRTILTTRSSYYGFDDIYNFPKSAILVGITLEGTLELEHFQEEFHNRVVLSQLTSTELRYPELREYVFQWMGYLFWRKEVEFKIDDHIRLHTPVADEDAAFQIGNSMIHAPFMPKKSPWELILVPHSNGSLCTILFRIHHALGDGLSVIKLFDQMVDGGKISKPYPRFSTSASIWTKLALPFRAAYDLNLQTLQPLDVNSWHLPKKKLLRKPNSCLSAPISMKQIKEIKKMTDSSFAGVVLASFAGGLRRFMLENGFSIPAYITTLAALPFPGHPEKLRNHFTATFVPLPLGPMEPKARLKAVEKSFETLRRSYLPVGIFYGLQLNCILPVPLIKLTASQYSPTAGFSNFPGPTEEVSFGQRRITSIWAGAGFPERAGVTCTSIGYKDGFRIVISIDEAIVPLNIPASNLVALIVKEMEALIRESVV